MIKVSIIGSSGTTGLRLKERLSIREDVELIEISEGLRRDINAIKKVVSQSEYVFLCLPDDASKKIISECKHMSTRFIDTSTAYRTQWTYGFPELSTVHKASIKNEKFVSVPGCHASGTIALLYPLLVRGIINYNMLLCITSLTGYSGGGKEMIAEYETKGRTKMYALRQEHKHLPEIVHRCKLKTTPIFMPVVCDYYSGMVVSIGIHKSQLTTNVDIANVYREHFLGSDIVRVEDEKPLSLTGDYMAGKDSMKIYVSGNEDRIILEAAYDNLGKGASGAAIQCFNIMARMEEDKGLNL